MKERDLLNKAKSLVIHRLHKDDVVELDAAGGRLRAFHLRAVR